MKKERNKEIHFRVDEKEKTRITNKAKKCGLPISEYIRKRALGYSPKALLPETFYIFSERVGALYEQLKIHGADKLQEDVLKLLDEIQMELLFPDKSKAFLEEDESNSGSPQSDMLCGEKEQPRKNEPICTFADSE